MTTQHWIKGTDNELAVELLDDSTPIDGVWSEISLSVCSIAQYPTPLFTLTRLANGDGVTFQQGILTILPGALTAQEIADSNAALVDGRLYRATIRIKSSTNVNGEVFGEDDGDRLYIIPSSPA